MIENKLEVMWELRGAGYKEEVLQNSIKNFGLSSEHIDKYVHCLDCGEGFSGVCMYENLLTCKFIITNLLQ